MRSSSDGGRVFAVLVAACCVVGLVDDAGALTDEEIFRRFQFGFTRSGARSLGMGGAYVSLAEDLTATDLNPSGLRTIVSPQLHVELGYTNDDTSIAASHQGGLDVNPVTGDRSLPFLSIDSSSEPDSAGVPSFIGYAHPFKVGIDQRGLVLAGSRQVIQSQDLSLPSGGGPSEARFSFDSFPNTVSGGNLTAYAIGAPVAGEMSSEIVYWNAAVSFDMHPDFSVGLTLTYATLELDADTQTIVSDPLQILVSSSHPRLPSQSDTDVYSTMAHGTDDDLTYAIGVHWHPGSAFAKGRSPWQFGASMRKGARFGVEETTTLNGLPDRRFENSVAVPDQYSIGASYRPEERWLFSGEVDRVNFSDLLDDYRVGVSYVTSPHLAQGAFSTGPSHAIRYELNDGYVYRLGLEYTMPLDEPDRSVAFRGGWARLPDTLVRMTHFNSSDSSVNSTYRDAFPEGDEENHFSAGLGIELGRNAFQVGVDASDTGTLWLANYVHTWRSR